LPADVKITASLKTFGANFIEPRIKSHQQCIIDATAARAEAGVVENPLGRSDESESRPEIDRGLEPAHGLPRSALPEYLRVLV
jgi:hypothetical protein